VKIRLSVVFVLTAVLAGCSSSDSGWNARVLAQAENPRNGDNNFSPIRVEVIADHCGLFNRSCTSIRLIDETGFANSDGGRLFTYKGKRERVAVTWKDSQTLQVSCTACDKKQIERQLSQVNFIHIEYKLQPEHHA
jgi:hypothetical protein